MIKRIPRYEIGKWEFMLLVGGCGCITKHPWLVIGSRLSICIDTRWVLVSRFHQSEHNGSSVKKTLPLAKTIFGVALEKLTAIVHQA
jgi:hypothetical protein